MKNKTRKSFIITILFLLLVLPPIVYFYVTRGFNNFINLEIIGEENHKISNFQFINQDSIIVDNSTMKGNIYVASFFFTSCPTICPIMTKNMSYLQKELSVYPNIRFLSHSVDPVNDTPYKLRLYIEMMKQKYISIDTQNWDLVTGEKSEIYDIAKSYFVNVSEDSIAPGGFLHSEYFVLIDKEGRIRSGVDQYNNVVGVYDGTNEIHIKNLVNDIKVLMAEYKRPKKDK
ncbi:MAG: SCO family protein [Flavobacteriales bacterium]|nr:SCO family protein [Flavobacteriales bacterium]MBO97584.1 SCO family protein [Flavobacteriales bacterium]|tara:strand:- start:1856 stop:2545 length:690 start_codon:yes stop_codon:yes gene_type:complete